MFRCPKCHSSRLDTFATLWRCTFCGRVFPCVQGVPILYLEEQVSERDKHLRDYLYESWLGSTYNFAIPLFTLPARPLTSSWPYWFTYIAIIAFLLVTAIRWALILFGSSSTSAIDFFLAGIVGIFLILVWRNSHGATRTLFASLSTWLTLVVPVKLSLIFRKFRPEESFTDLHSRVVSEFRERRGLKILDVSTGTCNSLYRHGWMALDAEFVGVDLSETMLLQGMRFMSEKQVPMKFALADAANLPFESETFDIVLSYGAMNALNDPRLALSEMARVAKRGALVLILDEQLREGASWVERTYFDKVLSGYEIIHECPVDMFPPTLQRVKVMQVYEFFYVCTCYKQ